MTIHVEENPVPNQQSVTGYDSMLTTTDNPFDPFTNFDEWFVYDSQKGYNTCSFLDRVTKTSDSLSETDQELAVELAIQEIVQENVLGIYKKVQRLKT